MLVIKKVDRVKIIIIVATICLGVTAFLLVDYPTLKGTSLPQTDLYSIIESHKEQNTIGVLCEMADGKWNKEENVCEGYPSRDEKMCKALGGVIEKYQPENLPIEITKCRIT